VVDGESKQIILNEKPTFPPGWSYIALYEAVFKSTLASLKTVKYAWSFDPPSCVPEKQAIIKILLDVLNGVMDAVCPNDTKDPDVVAVKFSVLFTLTTCNTLFAGNLAVGNVPTVATEALTDTILFELIAFWPITSPDTVLAANLAPVIEPPTILFALIAVRPSLSPVMDCDPTDSTTAFAAMTPDDTFVKGMLYSYDE
jgi:hypothetical protein